MRTLNLSLPSLDATRRFGRVLAQSLARVPQGALLLFGGLGAGKTTLTRSLVEALPGGEAAEVSSPSFTICNIYCTIPLIHHFDLYRLEPGFPEESLSESLDDPAALTIVEWPDRLFERDFPDDGLICRIGAGAEESVRLAELSPIGPLGKSCLEHFFSLYPLP